MRKTTPLLFAGAAAAAGTRVLADRTLRRWAANADATEGDPMGMPAAAPVAVRSHDGATLRGCDTGGDGPVVVLVHGWTGTRGHLAPVARRLASDGYRVVAVDQRGHGESTTGSEGFTVEALGHDMRSWLEELELRDVVMAGHSMGGLAIQSFALEHRPVVVDRVRAVVLISTLSTPPELHPVAARFQRRAFESGLAGRVVRRPKLGLFAVRNVLGQNPALAHVEATRATYLHTDPASIAAAGLMMTEFDLLSRLGELDQLVPVSVICGTHDQLTPHARNELLCSRIPGAEFHTVDGAGHMLGWEAPDRVTDLIVQAHKPAT